MRHALTIRRPSLFASIALLLLGGTQHHLSAQSTTWQTLTTDHFEIFYQSQLADRLNAVAVEAERAYGRISADLRYSLTAKVPLILLNSSRELPNNEEGALDIIRRSGAPTSGDHLLLPMEPGERREGILTHELTHFFELETVWSSPRLPPWVIEGLAEYERTRWTTSEPSVDRADTVVPSVSRLTSSDRDWGSAVFKFIGDEFGTDGIRRYLSALEVPASDGNAIQEVFGLTSTEFDREFERYVKAR